MGLQLLYMIAMIAQVIAVLSFFSKDEGIRGSGRIVAGISLATLGWALMRTAPLTQDMALINSAGYIFLVSGFVTGFMGWRKYSRKDDNQGQ